MNLQGISTFRVQLCTNLRKKNRVGLEILLASIISLLRLFHPFFLLFIVFFSFWARRQSLQSLGLCRPKSWRITQLAGFSIGVGLALLGFLIGRLVPTPGLPRDLDQFTGLQGSYLILLMWLAYSWLFAAVLEEVNYRAYMMNRWIDLVGDGPAGWISGLLISSALYGSANLAIQNIGGAISTFISGFAFGSIYLLTQRRNLWLLILIHGASNTLPLIGLFLGWMK